MDGIKKLARSGSMNLRRKGPEDVRNNEINKVSNQKCKLEKVREQQYDDGFEGR